MKIIVIILSFIVFVTTLNAQTIKLGPIGLKFCVGSTLQVPYQASGAFAADTRFSVQLSDANGSFAGYTDLGSNPDTIGTIPVPLASVGQGFRIRVASSDPYILSNEDAANINVLALPSPRPSAFLNDTLSETLTGDGGVLSVLGMTGDMFKFFDANSEPNGSSWLWKFDSTASIVSSTDSSPTIEYYSDGFKIGSLSVTNSEGCSSIYLFQYNVLSCNPTIARGAYIVTATTRTGGTSSDIWVKAGGTYSLADYSQRRIFVEPGGSVVANELGDGVFYLKPGSSFKAQGDVTNAVVMDSGTNNVIGQPSGYIDTFYCSNLTFDYSQVQAGVADNPPPSNLSILQSEDHLFANDEGSPIEIHISNILGAEVLSQRGSGALDVDLSSLPAGVYFAVIEAGNDREVKRIAVVH
jgi:hypothetical protein